MDVLAFIFSLIFVICAGYGIVTLIKSIKKLITGGIAHALGKPDSSSSNNTTGTGNSSTVDNSNTNS